MKFGNLFAKQIKGVAMGMSIPPPIANLFVGILEEFDDCIDSLKCFIDNGIGMWDHDHGPLIDKAN